MELTGDLGDFALADILQIMALSRKTGTILLEGEEQRGRILLEQGTITYASLSSVESFADRIIRTKGISRNVFQEIIGIGARSEGVWEFDTLVIESGILEDKELMADVRSHIRSVLTCMLGVHKGRFNIILNQALIPDTYREIILRKGLDVGEVLIEAARFSDELNRNGHTAVKDQIDGTEDLLGVPKKGESYIAASDNYREFDSRSTLAEREIDRTDDRLTRLCSLIAELNGYSSESDITLMLMRYAGELVSRAILFLVSKEGFSGLGQFGIGAARIIHNIGSDDLVRSLRIPLVSNSLLSLVVESTRPIIGPLKENYWDKELLSRIGGYGCDLTAFAVPLICKGRVVYVLYGDNYPGGTPIEGVDELITFAHLAGLILEKTRLEEQTQL